MGFSIIYRGRCIPVPPTITENLFFEIFFVALEAQARVLIFLCLPQLPQASDKIFPF